MRIGILGTGFGKRHAEIFASFPDVDVAGIAGRDKQKTEAAARSLGVPACTDAYKLINDPHIDAIDVCTPSPVHAGYAIEALQNGKHVFCETPVAFTLADAQRMTEAAQASDKLLLVALFSRFMSDYKYIHDYVHAGHLGRPRTLFLNRRTAPVWGQWDEHFILNLMLHDVDYAYWLLGKPQAVTSRALGNKTQGWPYVCIALTYADIQATVEGCGIMPPSFPFSTSLRVVCETGAIDLNWHWAGEYPESEVILYPQEGEPSKLDIPGYDPYEAECRYFVDCVQGQADADLLSIETASESLRIALAAKTSLEKEGQKISL